MHAGHDQWVQDLHHDGRQPRHRHAAHVGVQLPRDAARANQARVAGGPAVDLGLVVDAQP